MSTVNVAETVSQEELNEVLQNNVILMPDLNNPLEAKWTNPQCHAAKSREKLSQKSGGFYNCREGSTYSLGMTVKCPQMYTYLLYIDMRSSIRVSEPVLEAQVMTLHTLCLTDGQILFFSTLWPFHYFS